MSTDKRNSPAPSFERNVYSRKVSHIEKTYYEVQEYGSLDELNGEELVRADGSEPSADEVKEILDAGADIVISRSHYYGEIDTTEFERLRAGVNIREIGADFVWIGDN